MNDVDAQSDVPQLRETQADTRRRVDHSIFTFGVDGEILRVGSQSGIFYISGGMVINVVYGDSNTRADETAFYAEKIYIGGAGAISYNQIALRYGTDIIRAFYIGVADSRRNSTCARFLPDIVIDEWAGSIGRALRTDCGAARPRVYIGIIYGAHIEIVKRRGFILHAIKAEIGESILTQGISDESQTEIGFGTRYA